MATPISCCSRSVSGTISGRVCILYINPTVQTTGLYGFLLIIMASTSTKNPQTSLAQNLRAPRLPFEPKLFTDTNLYPGDGTTCLPGTREAVLNDIEDWAKDPNGPSFYWLHGTAGTGKTTIARTIAKTAPGNGQLRPSFFCSRDREQKNRNNPCFIFPVLAFQLGKTHPVFTSALESEPVSSWTYKSLTNLITIPFQKSRNPNTMIIIDALDECKDSKKFFSWFQFNIATLISKGECSNLKIFITSRPEQPIFDSICFRETYANRPLPDPVIPLCKRQLGNVMMFSLHGVEPDQVKKDIWLFFEHQFLEIKRRQNIPGGWPDHLFDYSPDELDKLCELAAGLFIYAKAIVSLVGSGSGSPGERLRSLLRSPESTAVLEQKIWLTEETTICSYYTATLRGIFRKSEDRRALRSVIGAVVLAQRSISTRTIGILLGVNDTIPLLLPLESFFIFQRNNEDVQVFQFHHSFSKFITDENLCTKENFYISSPIHHKQLLIACLKMVNEDVGWKTNFPKDWARLVPEGYADAMEYACMAWYKHLARLAGKMQAEDASEITKHLHFFLQNSWGYWELETKFFSGIHQDAVDALRKWEECSKVCSF